MARTCCICCSDDDYFMQCSYCSEECCDSCVSAYILGQMREPSCMFCKKPWTREFVMEKHHDKKWVKGEFLPHMGRLLMEQEKMLLPETQHEASLVKQIRGLSAEIQSLPTDVQLKRAYKSDLEKLSHKLAEKKQERDSMMEKLRHLKSLSIMYNPHTEKPIEVVKQTYITRCPVGNCRGFVTQDCVCETCNNEVCGRCFCLLEENHRCKKEDIETAQALQKETKPCPKCLIPIFKNGGCAQIFCTQCKTAFDWHTGKIETGAIHNPHFYEWLATNPQQQAMDIDTIACGELPGPQELQIFYVRNQSQFAEARNVFDMHRCVVHINQTILPSLGEDKVKDNIDLRIEYLVGTLDEHTWAMKLMNREKKRMKLKALRELAQLVVTLLTDFVRQAVFGTTKLEDLIKQTTSLQKYYEDNIETILGVHGGKAPDAMDIEFFGNSWFGY